ncbi:MAG: N-formylglutamate amidohydrolase [Geminicoccaceae bacterium]
MTPELGPPIDLLQPETGAVPLVISSPHSGQIYPPSLLGEVRLELSQLRCLEDGWVDRLFGCAPEIGAPLLRARFARAYVDPNREAFELDPELFEGPLPDYVNAGSLKARAGLGTIPSRIAGRPIYRGRLDFGEAERRIRVAYWPYHHALQGLLAKARAHFGGVLLLDCHSMPSLTANGGALAEGTIDMALGDRFGRSCAPLLVERAEAVLRAHGLAVARNRPYAGGHITARYGRPEADVHALQIEVRRGLYMDERTARPRPAIDPLRRVIRELLLELADAMVSSVLARPAAPESYPSAS